MNNPTDKEVQMKRILALVSLAALAVPAIGADRGPPFEQTQFDRGFLAAVANGASSPSSGGTAARGTTYEQVDINRGVPPYTLPHEHAVKNPVWSKDHNFIAPAQ